MEEHAACDVISAPNAAQAMPIPAVAAVDIPLLERLLPNNVADEVAEDIMLELVSDLAKIEDNELVVEEVEEELRLVATKKVVVRVVDWKVSIVGTAVTPSGAWMERVVAVPTLMTVA